MSFYIILESYMNIIHPCFLSQLVTICCPMQSIMRLSSYAHIYLVLINQCCRGWRKTFSCAVLACPISRFRFRSEQLHAGSKSNAVKYKVVWFYLDQEVGQAGCSDLLPVETNRNITWIRSKIINPHGLMFTVSKVKGIQSIMKKDLFSIMHRPTHCCGC